MEVKYLQVLVMPNGEILCEGKTVGFVDKFGKYLISTDNVLEKGYFKITSVHRDDLEERGFNTQDVSDETMQKLGEKLGNAYVESGSFWIDIDIIAEDLGIPKHNTEPLKCVIEGCDNLQGESEYCERCGEMKYLGKSDEEIKSKIKENAENNK